jgi:hypothetical protein
MQSIITRCSQNKQSSITCLRQGFLPYVHPATLGSFMQTLERSMGASQTVNGQSNPACHEVAHVVGELAGQQKDQMGISMHQCGKRCGYGCAHGVVVGALRADASMIDRLQSLCDTSSGYHLSPMETVACYHGVGHAMAEYYSYNLPAALAKCQSLGDLPIQEDCWTGVFMEVFDAPTAERVAPSVPENIGAYCDTFGGKLTAFCTRQLVAVLYKSTRDITYVKRLCRELSTEDIGRCLVTIGTDIYFLEEQNISSMVAICSRVDAYQPSCIEGLLISSLVIDPSGKQGQDICTQPVVDTRSCQDALQRQMAQYAHE